MWFKGVWGWSNLLTKIDFEHQVAYMLEKAMFPIKRRNKDKDCLALKKVSMDIHSLYVCTFYMFCREVRQSHLATQTTPWPRLFQCGGVGTFPGDLSGQRKELHPSEQESVVSHAELGGSFIDDQLRREKEQHTTGI